MSSVKIESQHGVDLAPSETKDRFTGVEDVLAQLAHRAARDVPDPQTRTEGADVSAVPHAAEPSVPATASAVSAAAADVAAPSVSATASAIAASPQVAAPPVGSTAADAVAGPQVGGPSVLAEVRPAEFRQGPFPSDKPSLGSRATRALTRFAIAICIGVAGSLAWQSYGSAAREMIASRVPQLAWISSRALTSQTADPAAATGQATPGAATEASAPQPAAAQAALVAHTATEQTDASRAAPPVPAAPSPDHQQLDAMAHEIGALRQSVEQLVARQEQMARDMAKLQAAETARHRVSAPLPRAAAAPTHKPPMPPQAAPPVLSAVSPALPPAQPRLQMSSDLPQPVVPPQPAPPPQPAAPPQMLRPPAPVPEH